MRQLELIYQINGYSKTKLADPIIITVKDHNEDINIINIKYYLCDTDQNTTDLKFKILTIYVY